MAATPESKVYTPGTKLLPGVLVKRNDLVGQKFNRLEVLGVHSLCSRKNVRWLCRCDCGGEAAAFAYDLRSGRVKSCGCLVKEGGNTKHGLARGGKLRSKEYSVWAAMVQRCTNPNDRAWANYGGRGVSVCERWLKFENFFADMGVTPVGASLDRVDNDNGYAPDNCRWASNSQQSRNKRSNVWVRVNGDEMVLSDACKELHAPVSTIHAYRNRFSLTHQEALDLWLQRKRRL